MHAPSHARHEMHIDDDIGRVGQLDTNMCNGRSERPHGKWNDIQRTSAHRPIKKSRKGRAHLCRRVPIVRRASIVLAFGTDIGPVLDARNIRRVRPCEIGIGARRRIELFQSPGRNHFRAQPVILFFRTVAPVNLIGFDQRYHLRDPGDQLLMPDPGRCGHSCHRRRDCSHRSVSRALFYSPARSIAGVRTPYAWRVDPAPYIVLQRVLSRGSRNITPARRVSDRRVTP